MTNPNDARDVGVGLVLPLALWLVVLTPQWILVLLGAKHLARVREAVARSVGLKLLAAVSSAGTVLLAVGGTVWVCRDLLGPERLGVQEFVANATLVDQGLLLLAGIFLLSRRRAGGGAPAPRERKQPSSYWCVVPGVLLIALALSPFTGRPEAEQFWRAFGAALLGVPVLIVVTALAVRAKRE